MKKTVTFEKQIYNADKDESLSVRNGLFDNIADLIKNRKNSPEHKRIISALGLDPGGKTGGPLSQLFQGRNELLLEKDISQIRMDLEHRINNLLRKKVRIRIDNEISELRKKIDELNQMESLSFLLNKVNARARETLLSSPGFRSHFEKDEEHDIVIMSIDIRRSTDLMLKARSSRDYALFITALSEKLKRIIVDNFGIYDKFTGDGVLSFFPDFYSGDDAIGFAIKSARECHECFREHYRNSRSSFTAVLRETGLGIGIDYGRANITRINRDITVVGEPVVYACRFSGAPAGETLFNQNAFDLSREKYKKIVFHETEIDIKHEGKFVAYSASLDTWKIKPSIPSWAR